MVIWPVRLAPTAPRARSIQRFSLAQSHDRPWCARFTLVYKTVNRCQLRRLRPSQRVVDRCNCVYKQRDSLVSSRQSVRQSNAHELVPQNTTYMSMEEARDRLVAENRRNRIELQ